MITRHHLDLRIRDTLGEMSDAVCDAIEVVERRTGNAPRALFLLDEVLKSPRVHEAIADMHIGRGAEHPCCVHHERNAHEHCCLPVVDDISAASTGGQHGQGTRTRAGVAP